MSDSSDPSRLKTQAKIIRDSLVEFDIAFVEEPEWDPLTNSWGHIPDNVKFQCRLETEKFIDPGIKGKEIYVIIQLEENGNFLRLMCPTAYIYEKKDGGPFRTFAEICWQYKMIRFEYDSADGEIRPSIHVPLDGMTLTKALLGRAITGIHSIIDSVDSRITLDIIGDPRGTMGI